MDYEAFGWGTMLVEGLCCVCEGNVSDMANTCCHTWGHFVISRSTFRVVEKHGGLNGCYPECGTTVARLGFPSTGGL